MEPVARLATGFFGAKDWAIRRLFSPDKVTRTAFPSSQSVVLMNCPIRFLNFQVVGRIAMAKGSFVLGVSVLLLCFSCHN